MKDALPQITVVCNGADFPKNGNNKILYLEYLPGKNISPNVKISLPKFISSVYYLPDRIRDLLEIAAYVFAADRMIKRGEIDSLEYHAWARSFHFFVKVRDFEFWQKPNIQNKLNEALSFMTGDLEYKFTFQPGHSTPPTSLFDKKEFKVEHGRNTSIILFSGGIDSLVGAIERLEQTNDLICLVSHITQPGTKKTVAQLFKALEEHYPNRVRHYSFNCSLTGSNKAREETQRTRAFLYTSIAFALACAYSQKEFFVYENGVTAINFPRRQYLMNARASRTTHPKTIALLEDLFSEMEGSRVRIRTPFLWKTKTDVLTLLKKYRRERLITSTVSCSKTYQNMTMVTHCGGCYQCIDRRFAIYSAELDDIDDGTIYNIDFISQKIEDVYIKTTLLDYVRQAKDFATWNIDYFYSTLLSELTNLTDSFFEDEFELTEKIWNLCRRHGEQVLKAMKRMRDLHDDPFFKISEGSLLHMISEREYLKEPVQRLVEVMCRRLQKALPIAFQKNKPKNENDLNDKINAILASDSDDYEREFPAVSFGLARVVPDHSFHNKDLLIESKYIRASTSPSKASEGIAADLIKYPMNCHILFIVYDPERSIVDDEKFKRDFERSNRCTLCIIR
ncbi:hypothetical protein G7K71_14135 [Desulfofundulus sp. TPOSR]|uniref:PD-(D/E)XK nuclease domain-containing protein n=1 Tax=Desulfofundulus sp. TPOSR TaxID=2714340 RepID=UPI00140B1E05|nr:7-cyano-7-deazaguanine synthase [Desulfofundulus sp. TPOSR]NHM28098.1 hypothetical protein [Desulfofundulus sp. TPOSR]